MKLSTTPEEKMLEVTKLMFGSQIVRYKARNNLRRIGFTEQMLTQLNRKGELRTGLSGDDFELLTIPKGKSPKPPKGPMQCPPDCPPYTGDWKTSIEAAFGPITSFISNLVLPDQSTMQLTVEAGHANQSLEIGGELSSKTQFDARALPVGFKNTMKGARSSDHRTGPFEVSTDGKSTTTSLDAGYSSAMIEHCDSGFEKAGVNYGSKYFQPGVSVNKYREIGVNTKVEVESNIGSFFIKIKGKIESLFDWNRPFENAAKTSADIENKLR